MGDFAAGKMGTYSGPTGTASVEDVAQAIVDLEGLYESKAKQLSDQIAGIAPATVDAIAATGAPTDLAAALKKRDGGHYLFDYRLFSCSEMTAKKAGDVLAIGESIDGDMIGLKDGAVVTISETTEVLAPSFGIYLLQFRDAVASNKVEWADVGWVSIDG